MKAPSRRARRLRNLMTLARRPPPRTGPTPSDALLDLVSSEDIQHMHPSGGHVGAVIASRARDNLWPQMSRFWADRDGRQTLSRAVR